MNIKDCCDIFVRAVRIDRQLGPELSGDVFFNIGQYYLVFLEKVVSIVVSILTFFYRPQLSSLYM